MKLRTISFITSALVTMIGLGSLAGYALDAPMLIEGLAGYLLMNPMTPSVSSCSRWVLTC